MVADRIKMLRETNQYTQTELARKLGITRASVNAWEMGISVPSTQYLVELASIFHVSTDFLLCIEKTATVSVEGLTEEDISIVFQLIQHLRHRHSSDQNE